VKLSSINFLKKKKKKKKGKKGRARSGFLFLSRDRFIGISDYYDVSLGERDTFPFFSFSFFISLSILDRCDI